MIVSQKYAQGKIKVQCGSCKAKNKLQVTDVNNRIQNMNESNPSGKITKENVNSFLGKRQKAFPHVAIKL